MSEKNLLLVRELVRRVPELPAEGKNWHADLPYVAFGTFALFLCNKVRNGTTDEFLDRAFSFLNELALSSDASELDLLVAGALEIIADDPRCSAVAEQRLNEPAGRLLRRVRENCYSQHPSDPRMLHN
jgi:hypothetical protein